MRYVRATDPCSRENAVGNSYTCSGVATTLAGIVRIDDRGFTPVPVTATMLLLGAGLVGLAAGCRRPTA